MAAFVKPTAILIVVFAYANCHIRVAPSRNCPEDDKEKLDGHLDSVQRGHKVTKDFEWLRSSPEAPSHHKDKWETKLYEFKQKLKTSSWQALRTRLHEKRQQLKDLLHKEDKQKIEPHLILNTAKWGENQLKREPMVHVQQQQINQNLRYKRDTVMYPQQKAEFIQNHIPTDAEEKYQEKLSEKREKRQILYLFNRRESPFLLRQPRTTPNPFIRQTNVEDYEIVRPNLGEEFRPMPAVDHDSQSQVDSYQLSEYQNVLSHINKKILGLKRWLENLDVRELPLDKTTRVKRSPKMSKLKKKQKLAKKKRKKKKQQKLTPRQIKHYRRIREHKEERRKILHKRLKEKRRLRHKKMGTGPYNKTIIDYYGVYFDPPSSQLNDSLYDSVYDSSDVDSEKMYEEGMKNYPDSGVEGEEYEDSEEDSEEDIVDEGNEEGGEGNGDEGKRKTENKDVETKTKERTWENKTKINSPFKYSKEINQIQQNRHSVILKNLSKWKDKRNVKNQQINRHQKKLENTIKSKKKEDVSLMKINQPKSALKNNKIHQVKFKNNNNKEQDKIKDINHEAKNTNMNYKIPSINNIVQMSKSDLIHVIVDDNPPLKATNLLINLNPVIANTNTRPIMRTVTYENIIPIQKPGQLSIMKF